MASRAVHLFRFGQAVLELRLNLHDVPIRSEFRPVVAQRGPELSWVPCLPYLAP
jgi:hypothetical protein